MLASITPLGERGRRSVWSVTVSSFAIGAAAAGLAAGALAGAAGAIVLPGGLDSRARLAVLALTLAVAIALDTVPDAVPGPRRQVNERWLDEYRGWVYGLGYGSQLGVGVSTVVSSAATYVALTSAALTGSPADGAVVFGCFGMIRGLTPLLGARVRTPPALLAAHAELERWRTRALWGGRATLAAILALSLAACVT
jgi:hypothetical protein